MAVRFSTTSAQESAILEEPRQQVSRCSELNGNVRNSTMKLVEHRVDSTRNETEKDDLSTETRSTRRRLRP